MLNQLVVWPAFINRSRPAFVGNMLMTNERGQTQVVGVFDVGHDTYLSGPHQHGDCWQHHRAEHFTPLLWARRGVYRYACPLCGGPIFTPFEMMDTNDLADHLRPYGGGCGCNGCGAKKKGA